MASSLPPLLRPARLRKRRPHRLVHAGRRGAASHPERRQQAHQNAGAALRLSTVPAQRPAHRGHAAGENLRRRAAARFWPHRASLRAVQKPPRSAAAEGALHADPAGCWTAWSRFRQTAQAFEVQAASVWMDIDSVDFSANPTTAPSCSATATSAPTPPPPLFDEWLIPICAPALLADGQRGSRRLSADPPFARSARLAALAAKRHRGPDRSSRAARYLIRWNRATRRPSPGTASRSAIWR